MLAGTAAVAADGVGMDVDQAGRLADAATLVDVPEDREGLVLGQAGAIERGPLAFREAGAAAAAIELTDCLCLPSRPVTVRFPAPRRPKSGQPEFRQQNRERSSMVRCGGSKPK